MIEAAARREERSGRQPADHQHLEHGHRGLQLAARPDVERVDRGEHDDEPDRRRLRRIELERPEHDQVPVDRREHADERRRAHRIRGDRSRRRDPEPVPRVEVAHERAVPAPQIDVLATRCREHPAELGVGQRAEAFDPDTLLVDLLPVFSPTLLQKSSLSLICTIEGIKVDFIHFRYPFIRTVRLEEGLRMLAVEDIAPMKLDAISGRGSKKDFYDVYYLLQYFTLDEMFGLYLEKYPHQTTFHVLRSLAYFNDAENDPDPFIMDTTVKWQQVKNGIITAVKNYT